MTGHDCERDGVGLSGILLALNMQHTNMCAWVSAFLCARVFIRFHYAARIWDGVKKSSALSEYSRLLS